MNFPKNVRKVTARTTMKGSLSLGLVLLLTFSSLGLAEVVFTIGCVEEQVEFLCNETDSSGACSNTSEMKMNSTASPPATDGFLQGAGTVGDYETKKFIQPIEGPRYWVTATGQNCSINPCDDPQPCLNGRCTALQEGPKLFKCDCESGFSGDWCEVPDICGGLKCDVNAECKNDKCVCKDGYRGEGTHCTKSCDAVPYFYTIGHDSCRNMGQLTFNSASEDQRQYSNQLCNNTDGPRPKGYIECKTFIENGVTVTKFNNRTLKCLPCDVTISDVLIKSSEVKNITSGEISEYVEKLQILTQPKNKPEETIGDVVDSLEAISDVLQQQNKNEDENATKPQIDIPTMKNLVYIASNIQKELPKTDVRSEINKNDLEPEPESSERDKFIRKKTHRVTNVIDNFARSVNLSEAGNTTVEIVTNTITVVIAEPPETSEDLVYEPESFAPESDAKTEISDKPESEVQVAKKKTIKVTLPPNAIAKMRELALASGNENMRLVLVLYKDASLLTYDKKTGKVIQASYKPGDETKSDPESLGTTFQLEFKEAQTATPTQKKQMNNTNSKIVETYFCVFYDFMLEDWSNKGCDFDKELLENENRYVCSCTHFTSFALLLRITKVLDDYAPNPYTLVTCSLSVICLLMTVIIYLAVRDLRVRRPTPIMVNICINLMIGFLFFLIGMDGRTKGFSESACYASAVIMHICFLCSWFWMLIYSLNMYYALVKIVGASPLVGKKAFMYSFGYGVPVLIVVIDLIVSMEMDKLPNGVNDTSFEKNYIATHICWIRHLSMYIAFTGPVGVILFINIVLFFIIIRKLTWKRQEIQSSKEKAKLNQQILMAITMVSMMGLTWIFGYVMLISDDPNYQKAWDILFNIFNTCQGIVIFFMSCVRQKAVREMWIGPIQKRFGCDKRTKSKGSKSMNGDSTTNASHGYTGMTTLPRLSKDANSTTAL